MSSKSVDHKRRKLALYFLTFGGFLTVLACVIFILTFYPVIQEEIKYRLQTSQGDIIVRDSNSDEQYGPDVLVMDPVDTDFGIVIPKIAANAPIIPNVNPYNSQVYQRQLTKGVAHAAGTPLPGKGGNTFLFAHSAGNFYEANRYNAVFYLLSKLEPEDEIDIFYKGEKLAYTVTSTQIVDPESVEFLKPKSAGDTITLMTCWPAGTTLKRLIVKGKIRKFR